MLSDGSTLVLTTREMDFWLSFQEVVPAVERVWTRIGRSGREDVRMFRVPLAPEVEQRLLDSVPRLKRIVITARTRETVRLALLLRLRLDVSAPLFLYVYGDGIEGFHAFGELADVLTERDTLVVSSEAEVAAVRCCFPTARVSVVPFPLVDSFTLNDAARDSGHETAPLAYVGRVSEQKNLHVLLFALWILRTSYGPLPRITLDVYGAEDGLGTPHSGLKFPGYGAYLERLAGQLGVDDMVTWHGFKPREWLFANVHPEPHVFVTPTVHSDENFGSSLLASLVNGHQAVATAWGGHFGFEEWFSEQLILVPVHRSTMGPVVDPVSLAEALLRAVTRKVAVDEDVLGRAREAFSESTVTARTLDLLDRSGGEAVPLEKSPAQQYIDERRAYYGGGRQTYADYADPVLGLFFEAYGMDDPLTFDERASYVLTPWTTACADVVHVDDPHRGLQTFRLDASTSPTVAVTLCPSGETRALPRDLVGTLVTQGYAFVVPPHATGPARGS